MTSFASDVPPPLHDCRTPPSDAVVGSTPAGKQKEGSHTEDGACTVEDQQEGEGASSGAGEVVDVVKQG